MKRGVETMFAVLVAVFIVMGTASVLLQGVCVLTGSAQLSVFLKGTVQVYANILAGIGGLLSFVYLMAFGKGFGRESEEEALEEE